ncbi:ABC transporter permease [Litorivivens sp.]|uniref:ABC transporter permease n=1 Tax=Litorivivens sp. TaxID=2020868 RepID=UPI00356B1248
MRALTLKLWRELWHLRGQVLAIALVMAGGVSVCVMSLSTYDSLLTTRDTYYREHGFADIFANLKRAPKSLARRIEALPGIASVEPRVVAQVNLSLPDFSDPISGVLVSIPAAGPRLNRLHIAAGRMPDSRRDEVLISDTFAAAHNLSSGAAIQAVINGRKRELTVVGIALSPEYIYQIPPGSIMPDFARFGVMWMPEQRLATAFNMEGAFNDIVIQVQPQATIQDIIDQLDPMLQPYGGQGAYGRDLQLSNRFLREEFNGLKMMAYLFPAIFLSVAVFLINVVVARLVSTQRDLVAVLKAFGYSTGAIAWHYAKLVILISILGIGTGVGAGAWLGRGMTSLYTEFYRFPVLLYQVDPTMVLAVVLITTAFALVGSLRAVLHAANIAPAEGMRPENPPTYRLSWLEQAGFYKPLAQTSRMILRHLQRRAGKSLLAIVGIALACAIMMVGNFQQDAAKLMMHVQFQLAQKQDLELTLIEPAADQVLSSLSALLGVRYAEGIRSVPVTIRHQQHEYRTSIHGLPRERHLQHALDTELKPIQLPSAGIVLTKRLADNFNLNVGDQVEVEIHEGQRPRLMVQVNGLSQQYFDMAIYMRRDKLNELLHEGPVINRVALAIDERYQNDIYRRLKEIPRIAGISIRQSVIASFHDALQRVLVAFTLINAILGTVIAFGVVYNTIRIALAERGRELASLRVLGYTRGEVAYILLGELSLLTLAAIPIGFLLGAALCGFMTSMMASDLYRIPLVLSAYTYAFSALVVILSAAASGAIVWWRIRNMDLVAVLKTRE